MRPWHVDAAADVLLVPRVLDRSDLGGLTAALMERLPGHPAGEMAVARPELAHAIGCACGGLHARLAQILAPAGLRVVGNRQSPFHLYLLHLDLHPFNMLVDDVATVTG